MRTEEQRLATKERLQAEREAHHARVLAKYPPHVRYTKSKFKKGKKHQPKHRQAIKLGPQ